MGANATMPDCKNVNNPCDVLPQAGEAWSVCLPWGGRIWSDANGVHAAGGIAPPDGTYGKIIIANGCLVGVEAEDVPLYTGSPCAPLPSGCGDGGSSLGPGLTPTPTTVTCEIEAGAGITITGDGTDANPYVISVENNGIFLRSDNAAISVTGAGTKANPFTFKHKAGLATTVNGMTFDAFGHLTSAAAGAGTPSGGVNGIVPGFGIAVDVNQSAGIATVSQQQQAVNVPGDYQFGGYNVTLDKAGQVSAIQRAVNIPGAPFTAACGGYDLTINQFGAITSVIDTLNLGVGYVVGWGQKAADGASGLYARFYLRHTTGVAGIVFLESDTIKDVTVRIDGQACERIGALFWGSGLYLPGAHDLAVIGAGPNKAAALVIAANGMEVD